MTIFSDFGEIPSVEVARAGGKMAGPVLGIETSCDETAVAVLAPNGKILSELVFSQLSEHQMYGGVVPEVAARAHLYHLPDLVRQALTNAKLQFAELGAVAATAGPGLIGGLIVGAQFGKGLALAHQLPFVAVNHLEAHALTARMPDLTTWAPTFPYLLLLLSGGHSQCVAVLGVGQHIRLGGTVDDAAGEAFDKVAKLLNLSWPGGPALEKLAAEGDPGSFNFPRPMLRRQNCDFSFSGLKTAVARTISRLGPDRLSRKEAADIAASFQQAVVDVLADRAFNAIRIIRESYPKADLMVMAGGVASNQCVRRELERVATACDFKLVAPPVRLCSDNAVMVAWAGIERLRHSIVDDIPIACRPRWPLETMRHSLAA